jgi:hypothetical protein
MSPSGGGLVPSGGILEHGDVGVVEEGSLAGTGVGVEVGGLGLVATHVVRGDHTLVLSHTVASLHLQ